jgi:molecular chaperone GrpE
MSDSDNVNPTTPAADGAGVETNTNANPLEQRCAELEESWKRAAADLANYRRQAEAERYEQAKYATEKVVLAVLPVLDNLKRAAEHTPAELTESDWVKGVIATEQQLEGVLGKLGLTKVSAEIGAPCDPLAHQPIGLVPGAADTICAVLEDGWKLGDKIIRPAKVQAGDGSAA